MLNNNPQVRNLTALCREALRAEADAIAGYADTLGEDFMTALQLLASATEPVAVSGIGKSGHVARKIASTFCSIGRSAVFIHPAEASHGDLGLIGRNSVALILSNSGETAELSDLIHYCEANAVPMVAISASAASTLGRRARVALAYGAIKEACPHGLAPTTSTTLALAIGDALAVGLVRLLGTTAADFRRYHPGGKLGAQLLRVSDLMHSNDALPVVTTQHLMQDVVIIMSAKGFGVAIVAEHGRAKGIITDGDMRRHADRLWQSKAGDLILGPPLTIAANRLVSEALELMSSNGVTSLVVEDDTGKLTGLLHIHDCVRAGVKA